jgi:uncharacterized protein (DUF362 family)
MTARRVVLLEQTGALGDVVHRALDECGLLTGLSRSSRVALKPNLTYPFPRRGVTTSPEIVREVVRVLKDYSDHIAIVECDGGYGAWKVEQAFEGHGLYAIGREFGIEVVSLHEGHREPLTFRAMGRRHQLLMPTRLLHETDSFITMPVPKVHCMTGLTLALKNQWGCVPDDMRLRRHYVFNDAICAINQALRPAVFADGTYFLDENGPIDGTAVRMNLVIAATDAGAFDRYVSELMGWSWRQVPHLRRAAALGLLPKDLAEIACNVAPATARTHTFRLRRTLRNWIALTGFRSRAVTWLGYESWFGRVVLHGILYAIVGQNAALQPEDPESLRHPDR